MDIHNYTYKDFLFFSLTFFGLQSVVKKTLPLHKEDDLNMTKITNVMEQCNALDLSDRARYFRLLYRKFYKRNQISRDKLITDMLHYCA
jgi:hypothetical protein